MRKAMSIYILAEMASSHEGIPKLAEFIINGAAKAKANGILLQIINLDTYIIPSDEDYETIKNIYLNQKIWSKLIKQSVSRGLDVWANVYDVESAKFCRNQPIKGFKLHSSNLENENLIYEVAKSKKELLLSAGGMLQGEIKKVIKLIYSINKKAKICLMYGLQNFPTDPETLNLSFIKKLASDLKLNFGYQDHSNPTSLASIYLPILFMSNSASIIEKHITHNRELKGLDYEAALNPDEFVDFVQNIKIADHLINKKSGQTCSNEARYRKYKSLIKIVAKKNIKIGEKFSEENLAVMRAKKGQINGSKLKFLLNKKSKSTYNKFDCIKKKELLKTGIFITARLKSTRLPLKAIKPILGKPMIEWMIERLKHCQVKPIVIMTSTNRQDDPLIKIAKKNKIDYFRGDEEDVLVRMRDCAKKFNTDLIISITGDNPLVEPIFIKKYIKRYFKTKFDFCETQGLPLGVGAYALSKNALLKVCDIKNSKDTEIWGPYFKKCPEIFKCEVVKITDPAIAKPNYRLTVDTAEDFKLITQIIKRLSKEKKYFNIYDICKLLNENPNLLTINAQVKQKNASKVKFK